ncbi:MAG: alpha/beta hydrolase [Alistipes sp.]|nr:alpha/beta hydrolase [Candidatus Minthomonas equi]
MCLFIAIVADGTQVDTLLLWGSERGQHKSDVQMHTFKPENPNGVGVIVCPGGSYFWLDERGEGDDVGKWLSSNGITAFVLFYRTAGALEFVWHTRTVFRGVRYPDMITDVQKALDWVRNRADEYKMAQDRIGLMGFSAGGHLVMSSACFHKTHFIEDNADTELRSNLRPDFVAAIYPVVTMNAPYVHRRSRRGLLGDSRQGNRVMRDSLSLERHIPSDCPPVFIVNCKDDPVVHYMNSVLLDSALTARGVGHKYLRYDTGKHGFGVSDYYGSPESRQWKNEFLEWLKEQMN